MAPSVPEIILLILIVFCVIGLGRLGAISEAIGARRARRYARREGARQVVDITPGGAAAQRASRPPKDTIDEAIVEPRAGAEDEKP